MAMIKCPECQKQVSDRSAACVNCGFPFSAVRQVSPIALTAVRIPAPPKVVKLRVPTQKYALPAIVSFFLPGAGQVLKGHFNKAWEIVGGTIFYPVGMIWAAATFVPDWLGLAVVAAVAFVAYSWVMAIYDAYNGNFHNTFSNEAGALSAHELTKQEHEIAYLERVRAAMDEIQALPDGADRATATGRLKQSLKAAETRATFKSVYADLMAQAEALGRNSQRVPA